MKRLQKKMKALVITFCLLVLGLMPVTESPLWPGSEEEYQRIVVLSDVHLPVRPEVTDPARRQRIIAAKDKVVEDINSWKDVLQIAVIGDLAAGFGTDQERAYAAQYFSRLDKPLSIVLGNHDYIYEDTLSRFGTRVRGDASLRETKIRKFRETFSLNEVYYSRQVGRYLLVFLSTDSLDSGQLTQMSEEQLTWLRRVLSGNVGKPTIIFFHAPLKGTVSNYRESVNTPDFIAQPEKPIAQILRDNPQIFLWVSGHNHTPATQSDFAAPINVWEGRVTNIHNADMDRETIWTNSLYLYRDKVVIKTFDHRQEAWLDALERTVMLPKAAKFAWPWQR